MWVTSTSSCSTRRPGVNDWAIADEEDEQDRDTSYETCFHKCGCWLFCSGARIRI